MSAQGILSERTNGRVCLQFMMDMEELIEEVRKVIFENHLKGSRKGYKKERKYLRADGMRRMSQREFDKKIIELEEIISLLIELLHEDAKGQYSE